MQNSLSTWLSNHQLTAAQIFHNLSPARLYEEALRHEQDSLICEQGALVAYSGAKTGRSPKDKRIVEENSSRDKVWWGDVNIKFTDASFLKNKEIAQKFLSSQPRLYIVDGFAGWTREHQLKIRIVCTRPYHALFMSNMLIRPTSEELKTYGAPDYVIYNAGSCPADSKVAGVTSSTSVAFSFDRKEVVILGTEYAGEMKKGVFTIMNYLLPERNVLSMHCSANEGKDGSVSLFFGLSGTGKTTLSADPHRRLIGDDEHGWSPQGVFNIEGGCYAKCDGLSPQSEPEIYKAIRFGSLLENVGFKDDSRAVDYNDLKMTPNTRASYPLEFIDNVKIPAVGNEPSHVIFLTFDAFGVLPPVSALTPEQAMYHFMSGYTSKVAGTEMGVTEPQVTFSACFGAAFMVHHPIVYAELLAHRMKAAGAKAWLVNTGYTGGAYGVGKRMSLKHTRCMIDAIHDGSLSKAEFESDAIFKFAIPKSVAGVPSEILNPKKCWAKAEEFEKTYTKLAGLFRENYKKFNKGPGLV